MAKEIKKIPVNNYIKLFIIIMVAVLGLLLFRNWYLSRVNYELNIPVITDTLIRKINTEEVYNYIHENENAIIYMGVASDKNCRSFEKEFNKVVEERKLEDKITYLNLDGEKDKDYFISEFNKTYDISLLGYSGFIIFENGKIKSVYSVKNGDKLDVSEAIKFLDENGVDSNL